MRGIPLENVLALGKQFVLDHGAYWSPEAFQVNVIAALCRGEDRVWLEIPEGNAKTTLTAIIGLAHIFFVEDAAMPVAAASRDQCGLLLRQAIGIVKRSPGLADHFKPQEGSRRVICPASGGRLQVYAADADTGDGIIPTLAGLEELHRQRDLELMRTWGGKLLKREGQMLIISTAGAPASEYELAKEAAIADCEREGTVTRRPGLTVARKAGFELRRHGLEVGEDIEDLELVKAANPLSTITVESLRKKRQDPTWARPHWARLTCGVPSRDADAAVSAEEWGALRKGEIPKGQEIDAGLDLAWKLDTTAITPFWMPDRHRRVFGPPEIVVPPRDGTSLKFALIQNAFRRIHARNPIRRVGMDPSAGGDSVVAEWLQDELGCEIVEVSPGNVTQAAAYEKWMEAVRQGWIEHPHDPEFDAHVLNAIAKPISHDRYRFDRPNPSRAARFQDRRVIDALIAASGIHWQRVAELEADDDQGDPPSIEWW